MNELSFMEKLLDGVEVEWLPLAQVAKIKHGKDWKGLKVGDIPVYGSGGIMGYVDEYAYDKPTVLIPRKGSITNVFYVETPFWNVDTIFYTEIDLCTRQFFIPHKSVFMMTLPSTTVIVLGGHKNSINNRSESEV